MTAQKYARLSVKDREAMVRAVVDRGLSKAETARRFNTTPTTVSRWVGRYRKNGLDGLRNRSSRQRVTPRQTPASKCDAGDAKLKACSEIIKSRSIFGNPINDKNLATVHYNRGITHESKDQWGKAIADYTRATGLNPEYVTAFTSRGHAYDIRGKFEKAIADYSSAIELDPKHASAFNNRGVVYRKLDETEKAIADYSRAIKLAPE